MGSFLWAICLPARAASVNVSVPPECGSAPEFMHRLATLVNAADLETVSVDVEIAALEPAQYRLRTAFNGEVREVTDSDCGTLFEAAVVIVALRIKPNLVVPEPAVAPPAPAPVESRHDAPKQNSEPPKRAPSARPLKLGGFIDVGAAQGILPMIAGALAAGATVRVGRWGVQPSLRYLPPRAGEGSPSVAVQGAGATVLLSFSASSWLSAALGSESHLLSGRAVGASDTRRRVLWTSAVKLEVALSPVHVGRTQVGIVLGSGFAFLRPSFLIRNDGRVHQPARVSGSLALRLSHDFL